MLTLLNIKNIAVIDNASIEFTDGFNVLTGETAAGKSIIIDSINMVLGERTSKELIRHGESKARVEAMFTIDSPEIAEEIENCGIEIDDGSLLLTREITSDGKSTARANGQLITAGMLKEIAKSLINIHGQHDSQMLLNQASHIDFLDDYAGIGELKGEYTKEFNGNKSLKAQLKQLQTDTAERERMIDMLSYQADEIDNADLSPNEEEELKEKQDYYSNIEKISGAVHMAYELLYSSETSAYDALSVAKRGLEGVSGFDGSMAELYQKAEEASAVLEDLVYMLRDFNDDSDLGGEELDKIEERLSLIYDLKRKYGNSVEEIIRFGEDAKKQLDSLLNNEKNANELTGRIKESDERLKKLADKITQVRKKSADELQNKITAELGDLEMKNACLAVQISPCEYNNKGGDRVEFLISTNKGEPLKPLIKIASGGELSRIMLAIRAVVANSDKIETMIFDEIDTGISGRTAYKTAEKIAVIAKQKQIICITHLAQIACIAKTHFLIKKELEDGKTSTHVNMLDFDGRRDELARIIGGAVITESTLKTAEEMLLQPHN